jgi:tight adherence protein C
MSSTLILVLGIAAIFIGVLLTLTAVGVFSGETQGVSRSLAVIEAFASAPSSMRSELDQPFKDRALTPAMNRALKVGRRLTPADYNERIRTKLEVAGNPAGMTVDRVVAFKVVGFAAALVVTLFLSVAMSLSFVQTLVFVVAGSLVGYLGPNFYLYQKAYDRTELMQRALPDALDLLTISVESGLGFDAALSHVARNTEGPLADEFARVLQEMQVGLGRAEALRALGDRTTFAELRGFVSAMVQADAFGIPIGQVLRVQSGEIRVKRRQWAEEQAQKVPVKILIPLIFCILPCLFIAVLGPAAISIMAAFRNM